MTSWVVLFSSITKLFKLKLLKVGDTVWTTVGRAYSWFARVQLSNTLPSCKFGQSMLEKVVETWTKLFSFFFFIYFFFFSFFYLLYFSFISWCWIISVLFYFLTKANSNSNQSEVWYIIWIDFLKYYNFTLGWHPKSRLSKFRCMKIQTLF